MSQSTTAAAAPRVRRRMDQGRKRLMWASLMALVGGFMPWIMTELGNVNGYRGAGLWVAYASMLGLAGAIIPLRRLAAAQGFVLAAVAVVLPLWQVVHLFSLVGFAGWMPGPGVVLCLGGGVLAGIGSRQLWQQQPVRS